jgi:hypothetical protein
MENAGRRARSFGDISRCFRLRKILQLFSKCVTHDDFEQDRRHQLVSPRVL